MCVEEINVIYPLIAFVIIFSCDIFLALIFCICGECMKMYLQHTGIYFTYLILLRRAGINNLLCLCEHRLHVTGRPRSRPLNVYEIKICVCLRARARACACIYMCV